LRKPTLLIMIALLQSFMSQARSVAGASASMADMVRHQSAMQKMERLLTDRSKRFTNLEDLSRSITTGMVFLMGSPRPTMSQGISNLKVCF